MTYRRLNEIRETEAQYTSEQYKITVTFLDTMCFNIMVI